MKKKTIFYILICFLNILLPASHVLKAQNVGIGTNTPAEKLHVVGNIHITGTIKPNGVTGQNNQVLRSNSSGNLVWSDISDYTYIRSISQDMTWTVPAGVTRIMFEAWGGGGGGAAGGGGCGGSYIRGVLDVSPGTVFTIDIGFGGTGATTEGGSAGDGEETSISAPGISNVRALGGNGATALVPGGPLFLGTSTQHPFIQFSGQTGRRTTFSYAQVSATEYYETRNYGGGGATAPLYNNAAEGAVRVYNVGTGAIIKTITAMFSSRPGAGGAGGPGGSGWGVSGATGMLVIYY